MVLRETAGLPRTADWRAVLLGPVADRDRTHLEHLRMQLTGDRLFVDSPRGDPGKLRAAYAAADVMAIPSDQDNFCNVVTESLPCRTPVISPPHVGASQLCEPLGVVTIRPLQAPPCAVQLLQAISADRGRRLALDVRDADAARFSRKAVVTAFEPLYRRVAGRTPAGAQA